MSKKYIYFSLAVLIFIIDRVTKLAALMYCHVPRVINKYLTFELTFNRGVSWGMLHSADNLIFIIVSLLITAITALLCWHAYRSYQHGHSIIGHVCIIVGSVSNMIDRVMYAGVIDFIILSYNNYSWPVFNIADAAIVCGVFILIFCDEQTA